MFPLSWRPGIFAFQRKQGTEGELVLLWAPSNGWQDSVCSQGDQDSLHKDSTLCFEGLVLGFSSSASKPVQVALSTENNEAGIVIPFDRYENRGLIGLATCPCSKIVRGRVNSS